MLIPYQPPWHLWGNTQFLELAPQPLLTAFTPTENTLVRASYGRPESWRFLFHMQNQREATANTLPGESAILECSFDLIIGIGRSSVRIPDFVILQFEWGNGGFLFGSWTTYTTSARVVESIQQTPITDPPARADVFVAQDITIVGKLSYFTDSVVPAAVPTARVAISAQISPNTHVRPDWLLNDTQRAEQFPGGEIGGR